MISNSNQISSNILEEVMKNCINLKKLIIKNCEKIDKLTVLNANLEDLNLRNCTNLKKLTIRKGTKKLHSLNLFGTKLNDIDLFNILQGDEDNMGISSQLIYLELRNCKKLLFYNNDLLKGCSNLKTLNIAMSYVTDEFVHNSILEFCNSLILLDLSWCEKLKNIKIKNLKNLKLLYFDFSENLESFEIADDCIGVEKLNFSKTKIELKNLEKIFDLKKIEFEI